MIRFIVRYSIFFFLIAFCSQTRASYSEPLEAPTYFAYYADIDDKDDNVSVEASLNLKNYADLNYSQVKEILPGQTISFEVYIPQIAVKPDLID